MEKGITKNEIVTALTKSPHGKLVEYVPIATQAAKQEGEFLAHLIAWNRDKGQIRDSKVALPIISLAVPEFNDAFVDNSIAHIVSQDPRHILQAVKFAKEIKAARSFRLHWAIKQHLLKTEENWAQWERMAVQYRRALCSLYMFPYCHGKVQLSGRVKMILFDRQYPKDSLFYLIKQLRDMSPQEAAGTILNKKIPFLIARGALGAKAKESDLVLALIGRMSPTELVNNTKALEPLGIKTNPALRGAFEEALGKAASSKKNTLKATKAAESVQDEGLKAKLHGLQERQIKAMGGVDGNWLVLGDKSGSMSECIEVARHIAATLAKMVKGDVHLVFFNTSPQYIKVTGKTYEEILNDTRRVEAGGGTSIGCGLQYALDKGLDVDGIAVISDGGENTMPRFHDVYKKYAKKFDKEPTVYFYNTTGEPDAFSGFLSGAGIDVQKFDLRAGKIDYYSLPNLAATMRVSRYSLIDEIMETPLLTLESLIGPRHAGVAVRR